MYQIYKHISPNGKCYIGQTCQPLNRRWRNGNGYVNNVLFYRAIKKYGWESFKHEVVCVVDSLEEANRVEASLIAAFKSDDPKFGYNISGGADGRARVSEQTRQKLSVAKKGKQTGADNPNYGHKYTEEELKAMSERSLRYYSTHSSPRKGKKASLESRLKMSASRKQSEKAKAAIKKLNASKAKRVLCVETGTVYVSAHDAANRCGFSQGTISAVCRGEYKQAYGFHWEYL